MHSINCKVVAIWKCLKKLYLDELFSMHFYTTQIIIWWTASFFCGFFLAIFSTLLHQCNNIHSSIQSRTCTLLVCSLPCDTQVHSVLVVIVLSVCVCEAWLFWFTEKLCWMSVSLRWDASEVLLFVHGHSYTPIPVPASVWVLEFAPTNRPLNLKHLQHMQTYKHPEPPRVSPLTSYLLPLSVCLATTLIGQPSNPHQFLGSQSDSPEPMRCRRGRWTWESPNQIPRSDQSRSLFCCMSVFLRLMTLAYLAFHLSPALPEWVVNGYN